MDAPDLRTRHRCADCRLHGVRAVQTDSTGQYVDDASITTKVKAALLGDSGLKSFDISVTTDKDVVHLSGRVSTYEVKSHATQVASGIPGVRAVVNDIVVN